MPLWVWIATIGGMIAMGLVASTIRSFRPEEEVPLLGRKEYEAALRQWDQNGFASYDMDLILSGGNKNERVHVEVRDGEVTECRHDGVRPHQRFLWDDWTIRHQFQMIGEDLAKSEDPDKGFAAKDNVTFTLHARFDRDVGYPLEYKRKSHGPSPQNTSWTVVSLRQKKEHSDLRRRSQKTRSST